jgi:serine/threonine protein phosphatase PrpC
MKYELAEYTLTGARAMNQDCIGYSERGNSVLLVLADGLGGHEGGELASELFVQAMIHAYQSIKQPLISQPSAFLALAILHAHRAINAMGKAQNPPIEPRTTCVVCLVQDGYAYWAHVGDSRLYLFRNNKVVRRTSDHTQIEQMRQQGVLSEADMLTHPEKSRLLRCVGGPRQPAVTLGEETALMPGDVLLLCTDGLWEALSTDVIATYMREKNLEDALVDMLMAAETKMGDSSDNISATCLRWRDELTDKPPLQSNAGGEVDHDALWSNAAKKRAATGPAQSTAGKGNPAPAPKQPPAHRKPAASDETLENEIERLESFLEDFLPKR